MRVLLVVSTEFERYALAARCGTDITVATVASTYGHRADVLIDLTRQRESPAEEASQELSRKALPTRVAPGGLLISRGEVVG
jgi:hypothetical protein